MFSWLKNLLAPPKAPVPAPVLKWPALGERDADVLARTLWGEARGEPEAGQVAVAHVIRNRAVARGTSATIECQRPAQFSCWWDAQAPRLRSLPEREPAAYAKFLALAKRAWAMDEDTVKGSRHYYAPAGMDPPGRVPDWAKGKTPAVVVGGHLFFAGIR
jgi:N-acetylmuramoyl-L-alanine amidase